MTIKDEAAHKARQRQALAKINGGGTTRRLRLTVGRRTRATLATWKATDLESDPEGKHR